MMKPASPQPALTTVRGFHTPVAYASGDEDSDYGVSTTPHYHGQLHTKINDVVSANSSPMLRSASTSTLGGISKLKLQLDTLNLDGSLSRSHSVVRGKSRLRSQPHSSTGTNTPEDDEPSDSMSYEIPLENDFISSDVGDIHKPLYGALEGGLVQDTIARKMAASDFEPLRCLGKGSYGTVLLVKQQHTGRLYAQKQFRKATLTV